MSTLSYWNEPSTLIYDNTSIVDRARTRTEVYPDVIPFIERSMSGSRRSLTNQEFLQKVEKIARYLVSVGVRKGDMIGIFGPNSLEWIIGEFAIFFAGAVSVHININKRDASDAVEVIDICKCRFLLIDPADNSGALELISEFKQRTDNNQIFLLRKSENCPFHDLESELSAPERKFELPKVDAEDDAVIFTTSGSTGNPKLVLHTHSAVVCNIPTDKENPTHAMLGGPSMFKMFNDRTFSWMGGSPIVSFVYGNQFIFTSSKTHPTKEHAKQIWEMMKEENCMGGCFLPYLLQNMIDTHAIPEDDDFRLQMLFSGGQIIDDTFMKEVWRYCGTLYIGYGFTESFSSVAALILPEGQPYYKGNVGKISKGVELRIVDDSENIVELESQGEIQIRQNSLMKGYFANDELTKATFTPSGWFKTGDIGYLREEGALFITGRKKDIISRGTRKIMPAGIEDKVKDMPGIKQVVVVGVPDDLLLEEICVCFSSVEGKDVTPAAVEEFCKNVYLKEETADGMGEMPKYFQRFESFPLLHNGKMNKVQLKLNAAQNLKLGN
ncbi:medium-chain acyl-CoA ligase ACSF2, mitochondrial-like [Pecten maximus]|uniref:medium-chain acyl-CoA ligase ACSF2, mitochondrial-like n=1 Tax=Pecten maximus TaxID=6579 RepID=UPI001458BBB6|nr:medium-chain acyl-CoA ligase ACSF2, mitochondrial-like [Pecten maximus]